MRDHRALPAFQQSHQLILAIDEAIGQLPAHLEAFGLGARMVAAAHSAVAAIARACAVPPEQFGGQIDEAGRRLREIGYYIDIAQRMGYLPLDVAVELLERQTLAAVEVNALLQEEGGGMAVMADAEMGPEPGGDWLAAEVLASLSASSGR